MRTPPDPYTWNRLHPVGSPVEIRLRTGEIFATKTKSHAYLWGGLGLVEVEGREGWYTLDAVQPVTQGQISPTSP